MRRISVKDFKFDAGKIQYRLIPPAALKAIATILTFGSVKYKSFSWTNISSERYLDALYRHLESHRLGEAIDPESGMPHLAHAAANLMFLLEREMSDDVLRTREIGRKLYSFYEEASKENAQED